MIRPKINPLFFIKNENINNKIKQVNRSIVRLRYIYVQKLPTQLHSCTANELPVFTKSLSILLFKQWTPAIIGIKIVIVQCMFYIIVLYRGESTAEDSLCVQICVLYYVLLYEDVRLANMKNILSTGRKVIIVIFENIRRVYI